MVENRRFPRVAVQRPAAAEVRVIGSLTVGSGSRVQVPVTVEDLSLTGFKLRASKVPAGESPDRLAIERGTTVTVKLTVGPRTISLPGNVVWIKREAAGPYVVGARMHADILDANTRRTLAGLLAGTDRPAHP